MKSIEAYGFVGWIGTFVAYGTCMHPPPPPPPFSILLSALPNHPSILLSPPPNPTPTAVFLLWAYVPESLLHQVGVTYYPNKAWALSLPAYMCTIYALSGLAYVGLNLLSTAPFHSYETLTDQWTRRPPSAARRGKGKEEGGGGKGGEEEAEATPPPSVPHFADLDIGVVNHYLYDQRRRR